jgi:hypothetical protein
MCVPLTYLSMQYTYIIRKYNIQRVENRAFAELFCSVYQRVQMNIIFIRQCTYVVFIRQCQEAQQKLICLNNGFQVHRKAGIVNYVHFQIFQIRILILRKMK